MNLFSELNGYIELMSQIIKSNYNKNINTTDTYIPSKPLESNAILHFQNLVCFEYTATNNK